MMRRWKCLDGHENKPGDPGYSIFVCWQCQADKKFPYKYNINLILKAAAVVLIAGFAFMVFQVGSSERKRLEQNIKKNCNNPQELASLAQYALNKPEIGITAQADFDALQQQFCPTPTPPIAATAVPTIPPEVTASPIPKDIDTPTPFIISTQPPQNIEIDTKNDKPVRYEEALKGQNNNGTLTWTLPTRADCEAIRNSPQMATELSKDTPYWTAETTSKGDVYGCCFGTEGRCKDHSDGKTYPKTDALFILLIQKE